LAAYDPTFRKIAGANLGAQARDIGGNAAISGLTGGVFKALPIAAGAIRGAGSKAPELFRGALEAGPVSSVVKGFSGLAEEGGKLASMAAKPFMNPGMGRSLATTQIPVANTAQTAGMVLQTPGGLARFFTKMYGKLGGKEGNRFVRGLPTDEAGQIPLDVLGERVGQQIGKKMPLGDTGRKLYKEARRAGLSAEEAVNTARTTRAVNYGQTGRNVGEKLKKVSDYGTKVEETAEGITGGIAKGAYAAGRGIQGVGAAVNRTARFAQPLENRLYSKMGAEELMPRAESEYERYLRQRRNQLQSTPTVFAQN
jgi:hypothetical protein